MLNKVVFVDKKACEDDFFFHDFPVITPAKLSLYCSQKKVDGIIVATSKYAKEIETEIRKIGIETEQIMQIGREDFYI